MILTKYVSTRVYSTIRNMNCQWIIVSTENMESNTAKELFKLQQSQQPELECYSSYQTKHFSMKKKKPTTKNCFYSIKKKKWLEQTLKDETENKKEAMVCNQF